MSKSSYLVFLLFSAFAVGCQHARIVAVSNARDYGESIRTRFRYRLVYKDAEEYKNTAQKLQSYYPEVFDDDGIPIALALNERLIERAGDWTIAPMLFTFGILPSAQTEHLHRKGTLVAAGRRIASVEVCAHKGESMACPLPLPFPVLVFSNEGPTCFPSGNRFLTHDYSHNAYLLYSESTDRAMAYGIASRLKEAEETGKIGDRLATWARSAQALSDAVAARTAIVADERARHGVARNVLPSAGASQLFEIVRCDNEQGKDFAYVFVLRRRGGGAVTLSDYGVMRSAFRSAIRSHYATVHPDVNPRALVVDFTEYSLNGGVVSGRVAVLSISPESLKYDSTSRKGIIRVRIGEGQFEDARRWIRRNLGALANRSNVVIVGDVIPQGARFYSEREEMRAGILEVSFRTE